MIIIKKYKVEIYNFPTKKWDIMKFRDYANDGKRKNAIFIDKKEAEFLEGISHAMARDTIKTRIKEVVINC